MMTRPPALLLLGTSHVGKSTCAHRISHAIGWPVISTDQLGRHPGRPWTGVPDPVMEFYLRLTNDAIHWFLRVHHENMRPVIQSKVRTLREAGDSFILEGAALRPEYCPDWKIDGALVVCLHVEPLALRERIERESRHARQDDRTKIAIEKFVERSIRENEAFIEAATRHDIPLMDVTAPDSADRLARDLISRLAGGSEV